MRTFERTVTKPEKRVNAKGLESLERGRKYTCVVYNLHAECKNRRTRLSKPGAYAVSLFIAATSSLTACTLFWKSARSCSVSSSSMTRSTPAEPSTAGTPT